MKPCCKGLIAAAKILFPVLLMGAALGGEPPQPPDLLVRGNPSTWETKIEQALSDSTTLEFIENAQKFKITAI